MPDFSTIIQQPEIRSLVQDHVLERQFHDGLYPRNLFRGEAAPKLFPGNIGDSMTFTGVGMMKPTLKPLRPGTDPVAKDYDKEQWSAQIQLWSDRAPDTFMPTSIAAIASLFMRNVQQLGLNAAQTLNRLVRDRLYNAGMSGWTVANGVSSSTTALKVKRLNGFTLARNPSLPAGSPVAFAPVSVTNPLPIKYVHSAVTYSVNVVGFVPDIAGDVTGPGTLTTDVNVTTADRDPIWAVDSTFLLRAGGGNSVDALTSTDIFDPDTYRGAVGRLEDSNVPKMPDNYYHVHMNSYSKGQIFSTAEIRQLLTSLPDYYMYKEFTLGEVLGAIVFNDTECPRASTVLGGPQNVYTDDEPFGGELWTANTPSLEVQRPIFIGQDSIFEYYQNLGQLITEAGVNGEVGDFSTLTNNGIEINVDRVQCYLRAPVNVSGDVVSAVWKAIMDWPTRTDSATGDAARFKRVCVVEHC
jgi:hypothetical protein